MGDIRDIRLEFLRSGPAHNQLLSPLTPYLALCGADGPVSVHLPFEHRQLLSRLARLRYEIDGAPVAASQRAAELEELGAAIGRALGGIPELVSALRAARAETGRLANIQLKVSAYELSLVPFELTLAPADSSGSSAPLLLHTLTGMTREIRRGEPLVSEWNRPPRILYAFASPPDLPAVPAQGHLDALRRAIDPWIAIRDTDEERVDEVEKMLTVLADASVRRISEACRGADYTHVHILAHGAPVAGSDERRFGLVLAADHADGHVVVDGESLALALRSLDSGGAPRRPPTVVTLATCDSGNAGSVLTPGGSIAHELHAQDIPWVVASQFPLWMRASDIAVETLYRGLLEGHDPRWVLHALRQRLRIELPGTHDWASIVAYAAIAPDLEAQVGRFRSRQIKARMEIGFARMDRLVGVDAAPGDQAARGDRTQVEAELEQLGRRIRRDMDSWCREQAAQRDPRERAERLGMAAASEKRIAIVHAHRSKEAGDKDDRASREAYRKSRRLYKAALKAEPTNHWVLTQFLSMAATPALAGSSDDLERLRRDYGNWWRVARQLAHWQLDSAAAGERVWAHGTLAELELLAAVYADDFGDDQKEAARRIVAEHCSELCRLSTTDDFPVQSTRRQFQRYVEHWKQDCWQRLAEAAVEALDRAIEGP